MKHLHYVIAFTLIVIVMLLALFNRPNNITYTFVVNSYQFTNDKKVAENSDQHKTITDCTQYQLPSFREEPKPPIEEIKKLKPDQAQEMDKVLLKYTENLLSYIDEMKKELENSYAHYKLSCKK